MDVDEAQARMQEIQRIMERATLFTLLPGTPAVVGGLLVLAGCAVSYAMFRSLDFADILHLSFGGQAAFCVMWFADRRDRRAAGGDSHDPGGGKTATRARRPSDARGRVLADAERGRGHGVDGQVPDPQSSRGPEEIQYIVPVWMMLYGTGVYTAGLFSIRPPRILGLTFLALGVVALLCFPQYGVVSAALSFGLLHIVFGLYVLRKQRQTVV